MAKTTKTVSFDTVRDADLLAWLDNQANASEAVRAALREHVQGAGVTIADVWQAVKALDRKIANGITVQAGSDASGGDAPGTETAALNLDNLGL